MEEIEFDVELTAKELYAFSMRHTYLSISGIFSLLFSVGCLIACAVQFASLETTTRMVLLIIGCLFTIVQPVMLYSKARAQVRRNKDINAALHYCLKEEGISVSQGQQEVFTKWYEIRKKVRASKAIYLYMSPVRAYIFPEGQCGGQFPEIDSIITRQMSKYKNYVEGAADSQSDTEASGGKDS